MNNTKIILFSPYTMNNNLSEFLPEILTALNGNVVAMKDVIVTKQMAEKHFDFLKNEERGEVINEWQGATITALLVKDCKIKEEYKKFCYFSSDDKNRQDRDKKLWFPEYCL